MKKFITIALGLLFLTSIVSCKKEKSDTEIQESTEEDSSTQNNFKIYEEITLDTDLSHLTESEKMMIGIFIEVAQIMDEIFWYQAYGDKDELLSKVKSSDEKEYIKINYGPWDRLNNMEPFVKGFQEKPLGANFYPKDMTKEEFEAANLPDGKSLYTLVRRDESGQLYTISYHEMFKEKTDKAAALLRRAASLAEDEEFRNYLMLRAEALENDDYLESDLAWMDMKNNRLDFIVGPIETYEDQLFGYKASHEAYILVKDLEWSERLKKFAQFLPELQRGLPVDAKYKSETPGTDSELNAYDVIYYAGAANAGGKTIAINLPNDEEVQLEKGTRRLQLKNAMRAKFDQILVPIADSLITPEQRKYISFDAFFANTMFHEVAHGLGIKNTINDKGTVRKALKEHASALEEGKADILGLYMVEQLLDKGELDGDIKEYYTTFIASIFRSVRFGAGDAHGVANMVRFNYFKEHGAFERLDDGTYKVDYEDMHQAVKDLSNLILTLQGNGDYE